MHSIAAFAWTARNRRTAAEGSIVRRTYFQYYPSGELAQEFGLESDGGFHAQRRYVYREAFVPELVYEKSSGDWTRGFVVTERTGRPEQVVSGQGDVLWEAHV